MKRAEVEKFVLDGYDKAFARSRRRRDPVELSNSVADQIAKLSNSHDKAGKFELFVSTCELAIRVAELLGEGMKTDDLTIRAASEIMRTAPYSTFGATCSMTENEITAKLMADGRSAGLAAAERYGKSIPQEALRHAIKSLNEISLEDTVIDERKMYEVAMEVLGIVSVVARMVLGSASDQEDDGVRVV